MHTKRMQRHTWRLLAFVLGSCMALVAMRLWAQEGADAAAAPAAQETAAAEPAAPDPVSSLGVDVDNLWTCIAAFLVFWMQAGFMLLEGGMTRGKNVVNIGMKNILDFSFAAVAFWLVGFALMFGTGNGFLGLSGFGLTEAIPREIGTEAAPATFAAIHWSSVSTDCAYLFQLVFAGTAATIVSGSMAERTKFSNYMIYSVIITAFIYPISGHWIWGGGWLANMGTPFWDFAGSTVVHSVGGWLALCGAIVLGPRIGKYGADGKVNAIPGHNFPMMLLGVFILWLGWFGFNPGSTMGIAGQGSLVAHIAATTNISAAAGVLGALVTSKVLFGKWDGSMAGNGALAGLVAITCPCAWVTVTGAVFIGLIAGVIVVLSVIFIDRKLKVDDPVGAISVHGVCGAWGTLSLGLFASSDWGAVTTQELKKLAAGESPGGPIAGLFCEGGSLVQLGSQFVGVISVFGWCLATGFIVFFALKAILGLRVSAEEEVKGLDVTEHGMEGYPVQHP